MEMSRYLVKIGNEFIIVRDSELVEVEKLKEMWFKGKCRDVEECYEMMVRKKVMED